MEEGSLLEHALKSSSPHAPIGSACTESTKNVLILDIYTLENEHDHIRHLLHLAELASTCNSHLQSKNSDFHWHYGGDGPVFGVHIGEERIPHLRAYCHYGPSVADEWMAVEMMLTMSKELDDHDVALSCWDVEDGQVILIQTAEVLPEWLDEDPTDTHHYACWIRKGRVQLMRQSHLSLPAALEILRKQDPNSGPSHPRVQSRLENFLSRNREHAFAKQRTPLVVPRNIANAIRNRPDLVHAAIQAFCDHIDDDSSPPNLIGYSDWVWTTATLSRTNYAMLRTMVSSQWKTSDFVPPTGVEVKRYKRLCNMDTTPHIQHAVQLGVRIVVGLELLSKVKWETMSMERRIALWSRIDQNSWSDGSKCQGDVSWILQSYHQGPSHAQHDLTFILKCPVFPEEATNLTLYSHPEISMKQQLLNAQKIVDPEEDFPMPLPDEVDDESWLTLDDGRGGVEGTNGLDTILSRFQNFMVQPSEVEGVANNTAPLTSSSRRDIRPRVFLNILYSVLKGDQLSFPQTDPFFYREDYDLMEETEDNELPSEMRFLMDAMDTELEQKTRSRDMDGIEVGAEDVDNSSGNKEVAESAHVLKNLLQSLEASAGEAGPVPNILNGMGSEPPKLI